MKRAFRYRFYPTPEQAEDLCRTLGCVRLVHNKGLEARTRAYRQDGRRMPYGDTSAALTTWKWHAKAARRALAKAQRALARKQPGSANRAKARVKVGRVHARIADRRRDHLHKVTTRLVRENQTVVIEERCSHCGTTLDALPLHVRAWTCATCGAVHDRDVNAARNILAAGPAESRNACGADVRPQPGTSSPVRGGRR